MANSLLGAKADTLTFPRRTRSPWPDAVTLREVLQHPMTALTNDFDLNHATVVPGRDGLPLVYTGRFAAVFRLILPGNVPIALRIFTSPGILGVTERNIRTELTGRALESSLAMTGDLLPPPLFLPQGVRISGVWYPVQILPWAEGESLLSFVSANYTDPVKLRTLAETIVQTLERLEAAGLAHGDLQHDNILVTEEGGRITLVDYDSLYAPELSDLPPPAERGHPHYQHPARTSSHYGPGMDRFAIAAIRTGLLLLANASELWERFGESCESILFTANDFLAPKHSPLFLTAQEHAASDPALADALGHLTALCDAPEPSLLPAPAPTVPLIAIDSRQLARWPSRVSPTCDEERIRPISYLAPLRQLATIRKEKTNLAALRLYALLAPLLVTIVWTAAWQVGGTKWPFLAYLFLVCTGLCFVALYLSWPIKRQRDALDLEMAKLQDEKRRALRRLEIITRQIETMTAQPLSLDPLIERGYIRDALSRVPVSRAISSAGVTPETVRALRQNGIETAGQLWQRHGLLPARISASQAALLRVWVQEGAAFHRERFIREVSPLHALTEESDRLQNTIKLHSLRLTELERENDRFPDATLRAYFRQAFLPPWSRAANANYICPPPNCD